MVTIALCTFLKLNLNDRSNCFYFPSIIFWVLSVVLFLYLLETLNNCICTGSVGRLRLLLEVWYSWELVKRDDEISLLGTVNSCFNRQVTTHLPGTVASHASHWSIVSVRMRATDRFDKGQEHTLTYVRSA